jgi:hypothetical protein
MTTEINGPTSQQELVAKEARITRELNDYLDGEYADHSAAKSCMETLYDDAFKAGQAAMLKVLTND